MTPKEAAKIVREALIEARRIYIQEKYSTANAKNDQALAALYAIERRAEDNSELIVAYMLGVEHGKKQINPRTISACNPIQTPRRHSNPTQATGDYSSHRSSRALHDAGIPTSRERHGYIPSQG